ncbi:MAG: ATP-binding protein [Eubacterium sp.]|nr:ATP-binding protein [Eubacterium sp.]
MKKRIQVNFFVIAAISIMAVLSLTTIVFYNMFQDEVMENLEAFAHVLVHDEDIMAEIKSNGLEEENMNHVRITVVDQQGNVVADSTVTEGKMENHKDRPEIQDAIKNGEGKSIRNSSTLSKASFYYAIRMEDGNILRLSKESQSFFSFLVRISPIFIVVVMVLILISVLLSRILAKSIVAPIEKLARNMESDQPVTTYKELSPFLTTIKKQHEDIVRSSKLRQEFTANVSHELKTPLTSISGYSELIENGMATDSDVTRFAGEIHKSANRLLNLINDILQLSKLDSMDLTGEFQTVDLAGIVKDCVEMLQLNADKRKVKLHFSSQGEFMVKGSAKMLEEMVYNLIDNGIRYNKEQGEVSVTLWREEHTIRLSVKDTGIGIHEKNVERIFERFYRVDKSRSKATGGTGLGLAIVKHIVVCHGASIEVKSKEGTGTEMIVTFEQINE